MFNVCIVDDDPSTCRALRRLLNAAGYQTSSRGSAVDYLEDMPDPQPDCLLLDMHMPEMSGLNLQQHLTDQGSALPIVFLTGRGDVPMSVQAMRGGAADFLLKPVDELDLFAAIDRAISEAQARQEQDQELEETARDRQARLSLLTGREKEVLDGILSGGLNKEIAAALGIAERTVKMHRSRVMRKLQAKTLLDLSPYRKSGD